MTDFARSTESGSQSGAGAAVEPAPRAGRASGGRPSLGNTGAITSVGSLMWMGVLWLVVAVIFAIVLGVLAATDGSLDHSLWQRAVAGWQRWILLAAGVTMTTTFGPMLVGNGATRARLASASAVAMVVLALAGSLFITVGYGLEGLAFDGLGWRHDLRDGQDLDGAAGYARLGAGYLALFAAYFASGWLIGIARGVLGSDDFVVLIPPAVVPAAVAELLLMRDLAGLPFGGRGFGWVPEPAYPVGMLAVVAAVVVAALVARRATRALTFPLGTPRPAD
ncbi:hypothetical protein I6A84_02100 [Frankia sp. CNm7]|uniref:Uncharacterized protein n=1 Tax=Frankia nepalensis TaxID=1836974 RepID=A0A937UPU3_9ACTN|nr:hypothetical protein [Frankia nepalensis]MBL7497342.1 hypothetical protein [Frankia nepalensis]MBL7509701.1 hypothetical protein [Frankia nepalensis]MBL7516951.1 hypothetical protein [Frankia nepalensis]MBL7629428.1 hypothetical protein [Frankia nepalensis]